MFQPYDQPYDPREGTFGGEVVYFVEIPEDPLNGLWIFGHSTGTQYSEDFPVFRRYVQQGYFYAECFSVACISGECGSVPMRYAVPITKELFEAAKRVNWNPGFTLNFGERIT